MNEDYSEILNKFSEILKEKDINLNDVLGNNSSEKTTDNETEENFSFDINTILKIKNILNSMNNQNNSRNKLLKSLKPYLEDTKKEKLEQYIKIANLLSVLDSMDDKKYFSFMNDNNYDFILMLILFLLIF